MVEFLLAFFIVTQIAQLIALILILREVNGFFPGVLTSETFIITDEGRPDGELTVTRQ